MPRPPNPETRTKLLEAAFAIVRRKGYAATTVDDICRAAQLSKGAFFHNFRNKEELAVAAADHWSDATGALFQLADYHEASDPLDRLLGYIAFRKQLIAGAPEAFTCLVGTMAQEAFATSPAIRDACWASISGHAAKLVPDIEATIEAHGVRPDGWTAESLARHTQAVLEGAFILAKASDDPAEATASIDHLDRYIRLLFNRPTGQCTRTSP